MSGAQWLVSAGGGQRPVWTPGGEELIYEALGGALMAVRVDSRGGTWNASSGESARGALRDHGR